MGRVNPAAYQRMKDEPQRLERERMLLAQRESSKRASAAIAAQIAEEIECRAIRRRRRFSRNLTNDFGALLVRSPGGGAFLFHARRPRAVRPQLYPESQDTMRTYTGNPRTAVSPVSVRLPDDGDPGNAANLNAAPEQLADNVAALTAAYGNTPAINWQPQAIMGSTSNAAYCAAYHAQSGLWIVGGYGVGTPYVWWGAGCGDGEWSAHNIGGVVESYPGNAGCGVTSLACNYAQGPAGSFEVMAAASNGNSWSRKRLVWALSGVGGTWSEIETSFAAGAVELVNFQGTWIMGLATEPQATPPRGGRFVTMTESMRRAETTSRRRRPSTRGSSSRAARLRTVKSSSRCRTAEATGKRTRRLSTESTGRSGASRGAARLEAFALEPTRAGRASSARSTTGPA